VNDPQAPAAPPAPKAVARQTRNPLHGITLETMLGELVAGYGWEGLAEQVALRCFTTDPSIKSSLKLLRKTPWARDKIESLYLFMKREQARQARAAEG
jgi:uncharacterized protein (DUF2132 family)